MPLFGEHPFAYIPNAGDDTVSVINTGTNNVIATIGVGVGARPWGVAVVPGGNAYVLNSGTNTVAVIDTATNTFAAPPVELSYQPQGLAVSPDGTRVYVSTGEVIDTATNTIVATVGIGSQGLAVTPDGAYVYAAQGYEMPVVDIATSTVVANVLGVSNSVGVAVTPDGAHVYASDPPNGAVQVIDTAINEVADSVGVGGEPWGLAVTPDGAHVYVAKLFGGSEGVSVISTATNTVIATADVGSSPGVVAVTPDGKFVYVVDVYTEDQPRFVYVLATATNTLQTVIEVGNPGPFPGAPCNQFIAFPQIRTIPDPFRPLNYIPFPEVELRGLEPLTFWLQTRRSSS